MHCPKCGCDLTLETDICPKCGSDYTELSEPIRKAVFNRPIETIKNLKILGTTHQMLMDMLLEKECLLMMGKN